MFAFLKILKDKGDDVTLRKLLTFIQDEVAVRRQEPRLSCSHAISLDQTLGEMIDGDPYNQLDTVVDSCWRRRLSDPFLRICQDISEAQKSAQRGV